MRPDLIIREIETFCFAVTGMHPMSDQAGDMTRITLGYVDQMVIEGYDEYIIHVELLRGLTEMLDTPKHFQTWLARQPKMA